MIETKYLEKQETSLMEKDKEDELHDEAKRLREQLKHTQKELEEVQEQCVHPKEELAFVETSSSKNLRVRCAVCKKILRYPGENDLEENGYKQ